MILNIALGDTGIPVLLINVELPKDLPINVSAKGDTLKLYAGEELVGEFAGFDSEIIDVVAKTEEIPIVEAPDPDNVPDIVTNVAYLLHEDE